MINFNLSDYLNLDNPKDDSPEIITNPYGLDQKQLDFDELRLMDMLDSLEASSSIVLPDLRIDDRDLKEYANIFEWCMDPEAGDQKPFARQLELMTKLEASFCPRCTRKKGRKFFNDKKWTFEIDRSLPVDFDCEEAPEVIQFLEFGKCPNCGKPKDWMINNEKLYQPNELDACVGQRAGKSSLFALYTPYHVHKYLKLQRPIEAFGLMKNSILMGTVVGLTYGKAVELMWKPIHNALSSSIWYREYHSMLDYYSEKYDEENLYSFKDTFIQYNHRNMWLHPSGPNKRTLRGATRFFYVIDELGFFHHGEDDDSKERTSANEVYQSLDNSLLTVREAADRLLRQGHCNILPAFGGNISSPSSYTDKIMSLIREYENDPNVVTFHGATWDYNPLLKRSNKFFERKYKADPIKAERDYGANPPMSDNPYIGDPSYVLQCVVKKLKNSTMYKYKSCKSRSGAAQRYAEILKVRQPNQLGRSVLTIDAGFSNNSFAITVGDLIQKPNKNIVRLHTVIEVAPKKHENVLNYTRMAKSVIYPLIEELGVVLVVADRWNSLKLLSDIEEDFGIYAIQYSLTKSDCDFVVDYLQDEDDIIINLPRPEIPFEEIMQVAPDNYPHCFGPGNNITGKPMPVAHLYHQCQTVCEDSRGMPTKGAGYTDDLFRALFLMLAIMLDDEYVEEYELLGQSSVKQSSGGIGVLAGSNNNSGTSSSNSFGAVGSSGSTSAGISSSSVGSIGSR